MSVDLAKLQDAMAPMNQAQRVAYLTGQIMDLEDEREVLKDDINLIYKIVKACGFDATTLRKAIKRSRDPKTAAEQDTAVLTYMKAMRTGQSSSPEPSAQPQTESTHEPQPGQ